MEEKALRQRMLGDKKTDRIIFAVTPEMKDAMATVAADQCVSVSALLTKLALDEIIANKNLFKEA